MDALDSPTDVDGARGTQGSGRLNSNKGRGDHGEGDRDGDGDDGMLRSFLQELQLQTSSSDHDDSDSKYLFSNPSSTDASFLLDLELGIERSMAATSSEQVQARSRGPHHLHNHSQPQPQPHLDTPSTRPYYHHAHPDRSGLFPQAISQPTSALPPNTAALSDELYVIDVKLRTKLDTLQNTLAARDRHIATLEERMMQMAEAHRRETTTLKRTLETTLGDKRELQARLDHEAFAWKTQHEEALRLYEREREEAGHLERRLRDEIDAEKEKAKATLARTSQQAQAIFDEEKEGLMNELELLKKQNDVLKAHSKRDKVAASEAAAKLELLKKANARAALVDELQTEVSEYSTQLAELKGALDRVTTEYEALQKKHAQETSLLHDLQQESMLLQKDKEHLSSQLASEKASNAILHSQVADFRLRLASTEQHHRDLNSQLETQMSEQRKELEASFTEKLQRVHEQNTEEMDKIKRTSELVQRQELNGMRRERDSAIRNATLLEAKLETMSREVKEEIGDLKAENKLLNSRLVESGAEIRVIGFEKTRASMLLEEKNAQLEQKSKTIAKLSEEVAILKDEYQKLQTSSELELASLKERIAESKKTIDTYTSFETELDDVVMSAAESSNPEEVLLCYGLGAETPLHASRRMRQIVSMATQLIKLKKDNVALRQREEQLLRESESLHEKNAEKTALIENASQPMQYFLKVIAKKNEDLMASEQAAADLTAEKALNEAKIANLQRVVLSLREELEELRRSNQKLISLKKKFHGMLEAIRGSPSQSSSVAQVSVPATAATTTTPFLVDLLTRHQQQAAQDAATAQTPSVKNWGTAIPRATTSPSLDFGGGRRPQPIQIDNKVDSFG